MPFWSDETWRTLDPEKVPVEPFDETHLEEAKYILAIGEEIYLSSSSFGNTTRKLSEDESFTIGPGQFAYILTHETIRMPMDAVGFISINASVKFRGLVNISGFHVDPGYHGRLIFSVFNAGPVTIHLKRGERIFPIWIADLDHPTQSPLQEGYYDIPSRLITGLSGNYTTAYELDAIVKQIRTELDEAKLQIAQTKSVRFQLAVILVLLAILFNGIISDLAKAMYHSLVEQSSLLSRTAPAPKPPS